MEEVYSMHNDLLDDIVIGSFLSKISISPLEPTFKFYLHLQHLQLVLCLFFHCPKLKTYFYHQHRVHRAAWAVITFKQPFL